MHKDKDDMHHEPSFRSREMTAYDHSLLDGDMFLQVCLIYFTLMIFLVNNFKNNT